MLQKKIDDYDKEKFRSKSQPKKKILHKPKVFKNLKKINNGAFVLNKSDIKNKATNINNKNKTKNNAKKNTKKKFEKLNITKNAVNVLIITKNKKINKNKEKDKEKKDEKKDEKKENNNKSIPDQKQTSFNKVEKNNIESFGFIGTEKKNENKENIEINKNNDNNNNNEELNKIISQNKELGALLLSHDLYNSEVEKIKQSL
jgi:hypothetical protein